MDKSLFDDLLCNEAEMARRAELEIEFFQNLLLDKEEVPNPGKHVLVFCKKIRAIGSIHGKLALKSMDAGSSDYVRFAGWTKLMVMWLKKGEVAGKNLVLSPDSQLDLLDAARVMACLHIWSQTLSLILPDSSEELLA